MGERVEAFDHRGTAARRWGQITEVGSAPIHRCRNFRPCAFGVSETSRNLQAAGVVVAQDAHQCWYH